MSDDFSLAALEAAAARVYRFMQPTPQYAWPLLAERAGCEVWVKHENHTPIGAFKIRGGINYLTRLREEQPCVSGLITATRGNHGQSLALAAKWLGFEAVVAMPAGNNPEKNAAMRAFGAELREMGCDFQDCAEQARALAGGCGLSWLPSYHPWLIEGVASYSLEFLRAVEGLDTVFVPIGMGSGISGMIKARDALGLTVKIVGVVAEEAPAYKLSYDAQEVVATETADTMADGLACRTPDATALELISWGVADIVTVSEAEIRAAMRAYFTDTHNPAEGAGAAPLAALLKDKDKYAGRKVGVVLSGGNVDRRTFLDVLGEAD